MPFAVAHIIIPIIILNLIRDKVKGFKRKITLHEILIAGIFGILPDIDLIFDIIFNSIGSDLHIHRMFTHNLVFPAIVAAATLLIKHKKTRMVLYAASLGLASHVILDFIIVGFVYPLYPITDFGIGLNIIGLFTFSAYQILAGLDAIILLVWIIHEEKKKKIKDFI